MSLAYCVPSDSNKTVLSLLRTEIGFRRTCSFELRESSDKKIEWLKEECKRRGIIYKDEYALAGSLMEKLCYLSKKTAYTVEIKFGAHRPFNTINFVIWKKFKRGKEPLYRNNINTDDDYSTVCRNLEKAIKYIDKLLEEENNGDI